MKETTKANCETNQELTQEFVSKGGQKDLANLKPVKRQVMRNGKMMTTTIYEDTTSNSNSDSNPLDSKNKTPNHKNIPVDARELDKVMLDSNEAAKIVNSTYTSPECSSYLVLKDTDESIAGVVGYGIDGDYLKLVFHKANKNLENIEYVAFAQLILKARSQGLGVKYPSTNNPLLLELISYYGLDEHDNYFIGSKDLIERTLGKP